MSITPLKTAVKRNKLSYAEHSLRHNLRLRSDVRAIKDHAEPVNFTVIYCISQCTILAVLFWKDDLRATLISSLNASNTALPSCVQSCQSRGVPFVSLSKPKDRRHFFICTDSLNIGNHLSKGYVLTYHVISIQTLFFLQFGSFVVLSC